MLISMSSSLMSLAQRCSRSQKNLYAQPCFPFALWRRTFAQDSFIFYLLCTNFPLRTRANV